MSDNLPTEMQLEIMKRLPVKSLLQFRSVSKGWYSLITSSDFIATHHRQNKTPHLLVWYLDAIDGGHTWTSIVDNDDDDVTFSNHKSSLVPPLFLNMECPLVVCCSDGLLCFDCTSPMNNRAIAVIWNISIRKEVAVVLHNLDRTDIVIGFGVCRENNDPTIVTIVISTGQVDVFKLSTGAWRSLDYIDLIPDKSVCVEVQGCIYWLATQDITLNGELTFENLIVSYDITTEEFKQVKLPDTLAYGDSYPKISLLKLRESLVVSEGVDGQDITKNIWRMEDGDPNTFTKLYSFDNNLNFGYALVEGFRNNGKPIFEVEDRDDHYDHEYKLVVYDPYSKHIENLGIFESTYSDCVQPYKESLHLLDQPNHKVYNQQMEI